MNRIYSDSDADIDDINIETLFSVEYVKTNNIKPVRAFTSTNKCRKVRFFSDNRQRCVVKDVTV